MGLHKGSCKKGWTNFREYTVLFCASHLQLLLCRGSLIRSRLDACSTIRGEDKCLLGLKKQAL